MRPAFRTVFLVSAAAVFGGAGVYWRSEAQRTALRNERLAAAADEAGRGRDAAASRARELEARLFEREAELAAARDQLTAALTQVEAVNTTLAREQGELERARADFEQRRERVRAPMPEGVRLVVVAIDECLARDGLNGIKLLDARALRDDALREVEVLESGRDHRSATLWTAEELRFALDRATGELALRFRGGTVLRDGVSRPIDPAGESILLSGVDGEHWEQRLPSLVIAAGEYPVTVAAREAREALDPGTMESWRVRLETLLANATTGKRWRVGRFRILRDAYFVDASIHGYGQDGLLAESASARRLAIEIDRDGGSVALLLEDGVLRKPGGETTIPATGYRMLLPGVTPRDAIDAMLGLVIDRR
ncbi:MAG: hypothetical protein HZB39_02975 [Planctomycetes bacterium]|nr:hypothetical protein [Planctomycetota bacterium]